MVTAEKNWFVFYTKSRQEKRVNEFLEKNGFETFLPLHKVLRQWSDRKKKVEVPLFNSYIFVRDFEHKIPEILQIPGIAWNIKIAGHPAILRQGELDIVRRFLETGFAVEALSIDQEALRVGTRAKIIDGPLKGVMGVVIGSSEEKAFNVILEGIDQTLRAQVPAFLLRAV